MQEVASPSSPPKRRRFAWLRRVLRWLWLTVALLLGLFGLLALVLQFAILPHIDSFRPQLEQAASRALGKPVQVIRQGDVVWCPPGVKHWHGAAPSSAMTHLAVGSSVDGKTVTWMEKVTDEQYNAR